MAIKKRIFNSGLLRRCINSYGSVAKFIEALRHAGIKVSRMTIYNWLNNEVKPDPEKIFEIEQLVGLEENALWAKIEKKNVLQ